MDQLADDIAISQGSLAGVLGAVGEELRDLGAALERLQAAFSPLLLQAAQDPAQHRNAQALDLLTQRLQAVAGFIQSLETQIPPAWRLDLAAPLGQITLSDLAARLTGQLPADPGEASGLFEMF